MKHIIHLLIWACLIQLMPLRANAVDPAEALQILQQTENWSNEVERIVAAIECVKSNKVVSAIPCLVSHIDFAPIGDEVDITMGTISKVYPVTYCLTALGKPAADGIIDYLNSTEVMITDKQIAQYAVALVSLLRRAPTIELLNKERGLHTDARLQNIFERIIQVLTPAEQAGAGYPPQGAGSPDP